MENVPVPPTLDSKKVYEIIVADDQNARTIARSLERDLIKLHVQAKIHSFKSVDEAMAQIQLQKPDVVVTDLHFGTHVSERDGIRFVRSAPELAFVIYTGFLAEIEQDIQETDRLKKVSRRSGNLIELTRVVMGLLTVVTFGSAEPATTPKHADHQQEETCYITAPSGETSASANIQIEVNMATATIEELRKEYSRLEEISEKLYGERDRLRREAEANANIERVKVALHHVHSLQAQLMEGIDGKTPELADSKALLAEAQRLLTESRKARGLA